MSCACKKHAAKDAQADTPELISPDVPCVLCGDKHLSTAFALHRETGYSIEDRARIVGELVLAAWHVWTHAIELARLLRDMWHQIQMRSEDEVDWTQALNMMNELVKKELAK